IYFILYFVIFSFLIKKLDLKTPGREDTEETKLYTKADYKARQEGGSQSSGQALRLEDEKSMLITRGLGGKKNISDVDCCATRLRCTVVDPEKVNESILKQTGPSGIIKKGQGIQIIYGPSVSVIKSNLVEYLAGAPEEEAFYEEAASTEPVSQPVEKEDGQEKEFPKKSGAVRKLCSPFNGRAASITETPDEAFAEKMMGDGYVVFPSEGVVYAPEDCEISFVFPSKHALGLRTEDGLEYLLHIGVDTVKLEGKGFEVFVQENDKVKKGDKLMEFDIEYIKEHAKSEACIGVFTSLEEGQEIVMKAEGEIRALDEIAEITGF